MRKIIVELILSFLAGVLGMSVWYYTGVYVYSDLYIIDLDYENVLTHYAIPIQIVATIFFYLELWIVKEVKYIKSL